MSSVPIKGKQWVAYLVNIMMKEESHMNTHWLKAVSMKSETNPFCGVAGRRFRNANSQAFQ